MRALLRLGFFLLASLLMASAAYAQWQASIRPDNKNGGNRVVIAAGLDNGAALYAQCDGLRAPMLSFISLNINTFPALPNDRGVSLAFDIDGFKSQGEGLYYDHGSGYAGLQITDPTLVAKIMNDIARAKFGIGLVVTNPSRAAKMNFSAGLKGAADAAKQFIDYCFKGTELVEAPVPEPARGDTSAPGVAWRFYPAASGGAMVLAGETDPKEGTIYFACDNRQLTLIYLSTTPDALPFNRNARSVGFRMEIDGFNWGGEAGYYADERGTGIAFGQTTVVSDILAIVAIARGDIKLTLQGAGGPLYNRIFPAAGASAAAQAFLSACG